MQVIIVLSLLQFGYMLTVLRFGNSCLFLFRSDLSGKESNMFVEEILSYK